MAAFQLSQDIPGVPRERVYAHLSDPQALLGLQPLLVAVERVRHQPSSTPGAAVCCHQLSAATTADRQAGAIEFEAVEAVPLLWGALRWSNRIAVRQRLLGCAADAGSASPPAPTPATAAPAAPAPEKPDQQPLRMWYSVVSPPAGLVRLEVVWSFHPLAPQQPADGSGSQPVVAAEPAADAPAAADGDGDGVGSGCGSNGSSSGGGGGGTRVQLDVAIQAPWLLR